MKGYSKNQMFLVLCSIFLAASTIEASSYDYSASIECRVNPLGPHYEGGLVVNPEFHDGLKGWDVHGNGKIEVKRSNTGNQFIVAYGRTQPSDSFSQWLFLEEGLLYTFSAWVQINEGSEAVVAKVKVLQNETMVVGSVIAQSGCWSMLKGGLAVNLTMPAELFFESENSSSIELWVDNVSLQPFTKTQWAEQQSQSIKKIRKREVRFHVSDKQGKKLEGIKITMKQTRPHFPLGCALALTIIDNKDYQKWFTSRFSFTATTFDNEMKWYFTEKVQGQENYTIADAMLAFAKQHGVAVRAHNIFWDNPIYNLDWVKSLSSKALLKAAMTRMGSVMSRYSGEVIGWDVMNENLHFTYFEDRLGPNASAMFYKIAQALDYKTTMFMNEYNTLEYPEDLKSTPSQYLKKIRQIRSFPGYEEMVVGIGLQSHFGTPNIPYMRSCLDTFGAAKMPIWITELDVQRGPYQAKYLEEIMREAYSHPAVEGIIVWSGWKPTGCSNMCLTDNNFTNLPAGDVVDKLIQEWKTKNLKGETDENGVYEHQVFLGEYNVTVLDPRTGENLMRKLEVSNEGSEPFDVWITI
ncbi:endo-1,4-beta-xylanase 5-like [Camellia sinensis]|uniref:endo-1,4-beta-xylanase 5-like n=1 Tax=Camellia sinensis TaxID=4442 RepID=UPI001036DB62|nr:endo-1,4-beta-xylanase 5-like [Camellia sinensis]XP_028063513.1 endo-1,4-beta-xylanase 5-like [Camellia sinensis]